MNEDRLLRRPRRVAVDSVWTRVHLKYHSDVYIHIVHGEYVVIVVKTRALLHLIKYSIHRLSRVCRKVKNY
jgi:hypothetical protein